MAKEIQVKAFDNTETFIANIQDSSFAGFSKYMNGGQGQLVLKLARKLDTFNSAGDVSLGNIIKLYITDSDDTDLIIYSGIVEEHNPYLSGNTEYVEVVCYGHVTRFSQDILLWGERTTLFTDTTNYLTATGIAASTSVAELADVVKEIIDKYNYQNSSYQIFYNLSGTSTVEDTSQAINYTFTALTYYEALESCRKVSPNNWYWYVSADNQIYFKAKPTTATHTFTLGREIKSIRVNKSARQIKNVLYLNDGSSTYRKYENEASVSDYGRRAKLMIDNGLADTDTMDNYGNSYLLENKDPNIRIELEIVDNNINSKGYDIESIEPGETCKIDNLDDTSELFTTNMQIVQVDWTPGLAKLKIALNEFDFDKFMVNLRRELDDEKKGTSFPKRYTEVT